MFKLKHNVFYHIQKKNTHTQNNMATSSIPTSIIDTWIMSGVTPVAPFGCVSWNGVDIIYMNQLSPTKDYSETLNEFLNFKTSISWSQGSSISFVFSVNGAVTLDAISGICAIPVTLVSSLGTLLTGRQIEVSIAIPPTIDQIANTAITAPSNGQVLAYNALIGSWTNQTGGGGGPSGDPLPTYPTSLPVYASSEMLEFSTPLAKLVNVPIENGSATFEYYDTTGVSPPIVPTGQWTFDAITGRIHLSETTLTGELVLPFLESYFKFDTILGGDANRHNHSLVMNPPQTLSGGAFKITPTSSSWALSSSSWSAVVSGYVMGGNATGDIVKFSAIPTISIYNDSSLSNVGISTTQTVPTGAGGFGNSMFGGGFGTNPLVFNNCTSLGEGSLANVASNANTAIGYHALNACANGSANNTSVGVNAGQNIGTGMENTIVGSESMGLAGLGVSNSVAVGYNALNVTTVDGNIAIGSNACKSSTGGGLESTVLGIGTNVCLNANGTDMCVVGHGSAQSFNGTDVVCMGNGSLPIATGNFNQAYGNHAMSNCTTGNQNIAMGSYAMSIVGAPVGVSTGLVLGSNNQAIGSASMYGCTSACSNNCFVGRDSGRQIDGNDNVGIGFGAMYTEVGSGTSQTTQTQTVAIGSGAGGFLGIGNTNVFVGFNSSVTVPNNGLSGATVLGANTTCSDNDSIVLGNGATSHGVNSLTLGSITVSSTATAGGGGVAPISVNSYLPIWIGGNAYKIALYNV